MAPPLTASRPPRSSAGRHPAHAAPHHRYSRFVGLMKVALPSLGVVLLGLVVAWPKFSREDDRFQLGFAALAPTAVQTLSMVNARYHGLDRHNKPFTVTAEEASEDEPGSGVFALDLPKADFVTANGSGVYVEARRGLYRQKEQLLDLEGEVNLFHENGDEMHTEKAQIDLAHSTAEGHVPVTGNGPQGRIDGQQGFRLLDNGKQIVILGKSNLNLRGKGAK